MERDKYWKLTAIAVESRKILEEQKNHTRSYMEKQKYLKAEIAVFFLMILIEAICAYYYPLTGDDRYFQSLNVLSVGKMIQYLKAFGNGRYLGN